MMPVEVNDNRVQKYLHNQLAIFNNGIAKVLKGDCIFMCASMLDPLNYTLKEALEQLTNGNKKEHLIVVLQTPGGSIELVEQLVNLMREYYQKVSFIVPDYAYSAGSILVLSGDEIYMNFSAVLAPIDPQVRQPDGSYSPGQGIIWEMERLMESILDPVNPNQELEVMLLFRTYDAAKVSEIIEATKLGISLVTKWLIMYKFKNWKKTATRGIPVTDTMKSVRAREVAEDFADSSKWHSHERGISMRTLVQDIGLQIIDYGIMGNLNDLINDYHKATTFFMELLEIQQCVHTQQKLWRV